MKTLYSATEERARKSTSNANAVSIVTHVQVKKCAFPLRKQSPSVDYYRNPNQLAVNLHSVTEEAADPDRSRL